ncbi:MAG: hypothetical protein AAGJ18_18385 [Bacteroidota bacterium]
MEQAQITQYIRNYLQNLRGIKVSEESTQLIRNHLKVVTVKSKDTLIFPGKICKYIYLVIQGGFVCRYMHKTGTAKTINFYLTDLHPIMACLDSYFTQTPTSCELKAVAESTVIGIPKTIIDTLKEEDRYFEKFYHQVVSTAMIEENDLKMKLIAYSSKEKYEFILQEMPAVIRAVPSKYIAEFCGVSAEWLSKLKKQN